MLNKWEKEERIKINLTREKLIKFNETCIKNIGQRLKELNDAFDEYRQRGCNDDGRLYIATEMITLKNLRVIHSERIANLKRSRYKIFFGELTAEEEKYFYFGE